MFLININILQPDCPSFRLNGFDYSPSDTILEYGSDSLVRNHRLLEDLLASIPSADLLVMQLSGDLSLCPCADAVLSAASSVNVPVLIVCNTLERSLPYRHLFDGTDEDWELLTRYLVMGGCPEYGIIPLMVQESFRWVGHTSS